jgi:hypothetical protein
MLRSGLSSDVDLRIFYDSEGSALHEDVFIFINKSDNFTDRESGVCQHSCRLLTYCSSAIGLILTSNTGSQLLVFIAQRLGCFSLAFS